MFNVKTVR